ncbi:MAG TPA: TolC family protein [Vicinamibacterales bacterium]|nr:TolC family protein [Vicinamibacterales bacterium]
MVPHAIRGACLVLVAVSWAPTVADAQTTATPNAAIARAIDQVNGLDVEALVDLGLRRAPSLAAADAFVAEAEGRRQQAGLRANPEVTIERREQLGGPDVATTAGVTWPFELGRVAPRRDAAAADRQKTELDRLDARRQRALSIRRAYGRVLAAAQSLTVIDNQLATARSVLRLVEERVQSGSAPMLDREQAAIEVALITSRSAERERALDEARLQLAREIGLSPTEPLKVRGKLESTTGPGTGQTTTAPSPDGRLDIRAAAAALAAAQARNRVAHAEGKFDLGLFGDYSNTTMSFAQSGFSATGQIVPIADRFHSIAFGLSIALPVSNRNQGGIAVAQAEERAATARLDEARLDAAYDVASAQLWLDQASRSVAAIRDEALPRARANVDVVREAYTLGSRPLTDVLAETRRLEQIESEYADTLLNLYEAGVAMRAAVGEGGGR